MKTYLKIDEPIHVWKKTMGKSNENGLYYLFTFEALWGGQNMFAHVLG